MTPEEIRRKLIDVNRALDAWSLDLWDAFADKSPPDEALHADATSISKAYKATLRAFEHLRAWELRQ